MAWMRSSNPTLNEKSFQGLPYDTTARMTLNGTVNKTGILLVCAMATALFTWTSFLSTGEPGAAGAFLVLGLIGGLIFSIVTIFKREWSPITAPAYALCEGLVLGGLSALFEVRYPGIAMQAVALTFGTLGTLLVVYRTGIIRVTDKFRIGVVAATGAVALFYFLQMILSFFHLQFTSVYQGGIIGIGFSLIVVGIAAMNLLLDFDFIERGIAYGAPKYMEWYSAFSLLVTLVWLYIEILRLLSKFRSRD
jgi:uncharacterized YccA/Bax inhibitor family protein